MSKCKNFFRHYIKGEYHCDTCPFCWEERGIEDADAGCYIFGDLRDTCRLLPPFRFLIGWPKRKRAIYYADHEYDDFGDWYEEKLRKEDKLKELLEKYFPDDKVKSAMGWGIASQAEDIFIPVKWEPLKTRWKKLIKDTWEAFLMCFKPYFCQ